MSKTISIDKLQAGMVIIKVSAQNGPVKIRKSGLVSSMDMVSALKEMGVLEIEIDPEITVEIKQPKIAKSKTQLLLEDSKTLTHDADSSISEQFNRNLFLPSVQELPEAWQYYGKKIAVIFIVILGGVGSGWSISQFPVWMQIYSANTQIVEQPSQAVEVPSQADEVPSQTVEVPTQAVEVSQDSPQLRISEAIEPTQPLPIDSQQLEVSDSGATQEVNAIATSPPVTEPNISPELLKRFQDAVESLDTEKTNNQDGGAGDSKYNSDYQDEILSTITPVHKLPARVLTRLPSMAFSTHMYASNPQDRWVRVNGKRIIEGQQIERGLVLIGIEPQHVILNFEGQEFRMDALTDW